MQNTVIPAHVILQMWQTQNESGGQRWMKRKFLNIWWKVIDSILKFLIHVSNLISVYILVTIDIATIFKNILEIITYHLLS